VVMRIGLALLAWAVLFSRKFKSSGFENASAADHSGKWSQSGKMGRYLKYKTRKEHSK
jgi:hypothetical protein